MKKLVTVLCCVGLAASLTSCSIDGLQDAADGLSSKGVTIEQQRTDLVAEQITKAWDFKLLNNTTIRATDISVGNAGCYGVRGIVIPTEKQVGFAVVSGRYPDAETCLSDIRYTAIDIPVPGGINGRPVVQLTTLPAGMLHK